MARSRRPRRNPSIPRLEWVAKNYPFDVLYYTVNGWLGAVGLDHVMEDVRAARVELEGAYWRQEPGASDAIKEGVLDAVRNSADGEYANTEYDKYIPWLAKSIRAVSKKPTKKFAKFLNEHQVELYPGAGPTTWFPELTEMPPEEGWTVGKEWGPEGRDLEWAVQGADVHASELRRNFGTVVRWAIETGGNPDDHDPMELVHIAKEWARTKPKDMDIVGGDVVYEFDDGWTFQELKTRAQLRCEGEYLDHCVKGYRPSKVGVVYRIYSLRDPDGRPVATMEWRVGDEYVYQYYGLSNQRVGRDEIDRGIEFYIKYIDPELTPNSPKVVPVDASRWPPLATEWAGDFKGMYEFEGDPDTAFAVYGIEKSNGLEYRILVTMKSLADPRVWDERDHYVPIGEIMLRPDGVGSVSPEHLEQRHSDLSEYGYPGIWSLWIAAGVIPFSLNDVLLKNIANADTSVWEGFVQGRNINPRKRRKAKRKTPEYKRILNRSHRLWETYDAKPLKKNLLAFGAHIERMKKSTSLQVKTEARRAARAFNAEFRARGWKK